MPFASFCKTVRVQLGKKGHDKLWESNKVELLGKIIDNKLQFDSLF